MMKAIAPPKVGMTKYMYIKHFEKFPSVFGGYICECPSKKMRDIMPGFRCKIPLTIDYCGESIRTLPFLDLVIYIYLGS